MTSTARAALDILPPELWDAILSEFDEPNPHLLLPLSLVCRTFNQLAISRYLALAHVSQEDLANGRMSIAGDDVRVLQYAPGLVASLTTLECTHLVDHGLARNLRLVRRLAPGLEELHLRFAHDLLEEESHHHDVVPTVCEVVRALAARSSGVIVMGKEALFWCLPEDVAQWQLHTEPIRTFMLKAKQKQGFLVIRDRDAQPVKVRLVSELEAVSVRLVQGVDGKRIALVVFNAASIESRNLTLGPTVGTALSPYSMTGEELNAVLPHLVLPALRHLYVTSAAVKPRALSTFLLSHPNLVFLGYDLPAQTKPSSVFIDPPLAHPNLLCIRVTDPAHLVPVLDGLGSSPRLAEIGFHFIRPKPVPQLSLMTKRPPSALTAALERVAQHPRELRLNIRLTGPQGSSVILRTRRTQRPPDADERRAMAGLAHVHRIDVDCASVGAARALLPWLDLVPALRKVEFRSTTGIFAWGGRPGHRSLHEDTIEFMDDAMKGLPRVNEVVVKETPVFIR